MEVKVDIREDAKRISGLNKEELSLIAQQAVKEALWKELLLKILDKALEKSEMTDKLALKLGDELKEQVAKRHGLA